MTEHGWNDPPQFSYQSLSANTKKTSLLNKRVSHPPPDTLASSKLANPLTSIPHDSEPPSEPPPPTAPPSSTHGYGSIVSSGKDVEEPTTEFENSIEDIVEYLEQLLVNVQTSMEAKLAGDIKRRLTLFSKQYKDGRISAAVHLGMSKLVEALRAGDHEGAEKLHVALMVDHVSEVRQWMVGVKKLVQAVKAKPQQA